jgi:PAS domain S-box-containing protein
MLMHTRLDQTAAPDFRALFMAAPIPSVVLVPEASGFTIVEVNEAYLRATGTERATLIGRGILEALPGNSLHPCGGAAALRASLDRVVSSKQPDTMEAQRREIRNPAGALEELCWSPVNTPVLDEAGRISAIIHQFQETSTLRGTDRRDAPETDADASAEISGGNMAFAEDALRESEEQLRLITDAVPALIAYVDHEQRYRFVNRAYVEWSGLPGEELIGRHMHTVVGDGSYASMRPMIEAALAGETVRFESIVAPDDVPPQHRDGASRYFDMSFIPRLSADDHRVEGLYVLGVDVSERKQAEDALRRSDAFANLLLESTSDCVKVLDEGGHILSVNSPGRAAFDVDESTVIEGTEYASYYPPEGSDGVRRAVAAALAGGMGRYFGPGKTAKGAWGWWDVIVTPIACAPGEPRRLLGVTRDVTELRRAEDELRRLNETLEQRVAETLAERKVLADVVESSDALIQVLDLDYRILAINKANIAAMERDCGRRPKIGDSLLDLFADHPEHLAQVQATWARALAGEEFTLSDEFEGAERERPYYETSFKVLRDRDGNRIGAFQFAYDVTERLRRDDRLRKTEEALRQSQKLEAIGQLTGGLAHDFNNLLTVILSAADLLRRPSLQEDRRRRYVDAISETAARAAKLTGQLLAFARRQALKPEIFEAGARIRSLADMLLSVADPRSQIAIQVEAGECYVEADPTQFETAVINMVVNARDAMSDDGKLTILIGLASEVPALRGLAATQGEFVAVTIHDTGSGIAPEHLDRIFEPFFTTKETGKGTGLGLSQVFGFAKQSGGEVTVESEVGRGTSFTLYLPRAEAPVAHEGEATDAAGAWQGQGCGHVLVVEDNRKVGEFAGQMLVDLGFEATWVGNAQAALELTQEHPGRFDIVFSDVVMPGMSGLELAKELRSRYPKLPVVLTSGYSHVIAEQGTHGFELLHKPYSVEELARVLRRQTKPHAQAAN